MAKGGQFERDICRSLSLWWSGGKHDDLFWRTAGSGGRATVRRKKGKGTKGHAGDITNTSKHGAGFMRLVTLELKRGYNKNTLHDILDQGRANAQPMYETWFKQAEASRNIAKSDWWWLIVRRDKHDALLIAPHSFHDAFADSIPNPVGTIWKHSVNVYRFDAVLRTRKGKRLAKEMKYAIRNRS